MADDFHELSPYVLIGNPLTLAIIEFFAVPGALLGAVLYPFGLDGPVWRCLGFGIDLVTAIARLIAAAPGASLPVKSFAPFAILFLSLAVLSLVLWRTWIFRAMAIPFAVLGLFGAANGEGFDLAVAPGGDAAAMRLPPASSLCSVAGGAFVAEQWLRADADTRAPADARGGVSCDDLGCVGGSVDGRSVALVTDRKALIEDCARAAIVIAPFYAPAGCAASNSPRPSQARRDGGGDIALYRRGGAMAHGPRPGRGPSLVARPAAPDGGDVASGRPSLRGGGWSELGQTPSSRLAHSAMKGTDFQASSILSRESNMTSIT